MSPMPIEHVVERWRESILEKDVAAAAALRDADYSATLPDGRVITSDDDLAMLASPQHTIIAVTTDDLTVDDRQNLATARFTCVVEGEFGGRRWSVHLVVEFRRRDGEWLARSSRAMVIENVAMYEDRPSRKSRIASWLRRNLGAKRPASFPELAYLPYRPGLDYVLPPDPPNQPDELPMPPRELWLSYNYPVHGKQHVDQMLEILNASDFAFRKHDRILDLGCGAGRMIRHLQPLAGTCEIWGTDISSQHIIWCKRHLSPPFHFATTTKVPHLPFEDRSFRFIYCGSLFTHIDELADAWLLELRRILAPDGRLYVTIHDRHTIDLMTTGAYQTAAIAQLLRTRSAFQQSTDPFGMFTVGRDHEAQVFYDLDFFIRMLRAKFDVLSVTQEAYFYQTALLLKRTSNQG